MESNIIIIAACIPTLAPLLDMVLGRKVLGSSSGGRYHSSQYGKRSGHIRTSSYELGSEKRSVVRDTVRETRRASCPGMRSAGTQSREGTTSSSSMGIGVRRTTTVPRGGGRISRSGTSLRLIQIHEIVSCSGCIYVVYLSISRTDPGFFL